MREHISAQSGLDMCPEGRHYVSPGVSANPEGISEPRDLHSVCPPGICYECTSLNNAYSTSKCRATFPRSLAIGFGYIQLSSCPAL